MEENLKYFLGRDYYGKLFNDRRIRYEPLELMRGATFNDSYMILDEAQNCTIEQIKMFITRMGKESKVMINGDIRQTDIRNFSGLMDCVDRLEDVEGVATSRLYNEDIQRNGIIGRVLEALEEEYDD
jgi:phosphate starvation-inducible PhoH-like protein